MLFTPTTDFLTISELLGEAWGVGIGASIIQYIAWSDHVGIFSALEKHSELRRSDLLQYTSLSEAGIDALIPILQALTLVNEGPGGALELSSLAREYLLKSSPYYVGNGLFVRHTRELPPTYQQTPEKPYERKAAWDVDLRLRIQHSRNFAASVVAARGSEFQDIKRLVDVGGGSGVLAIPLAVDHPDMEITILELPESLPHIQEFLSPYDLASRITVRATDVIHDSWNVPECDGVYFGNIFHSQNDQICRSLCDKSYRVLRPGGKIFVHEVLFTEAKDGPLLAALWNAVMLHQPEAGRQRTASELKAILESAGFSECTLRPTASGYSLISAMKTSSTASQVGFPL